MAEIYNEPKELSDLIDKESDNVLYILRGFIRNPQQIDEDNKERRKIIGTLEVSGSRQTRPYLIPISVDYSLSNKLSVEQVVNILKSFEIKNLELSVKGKYTNKVKGIFNRIFNVDRIDPKNYLDSWLDFIQQ